MQYPEPIAKLIDSYTKLPGIGSKTATRLAFFTLDMDEKDVENFAKCQPRKICIFAAFAATLLKVIRA